MKKVLNYLGATIGMLGALLLVGTAGAAEWGSITFGQAIVQLIISIGIMVLGGRLFATTYEPEESDYE